MCLNVCKEPSGNYMEVYSDLQKTESENVEISQSDINQESFLSETVKINLERNYKNLYKSFKVEDLNKLRNDVLEIAKKGVVYPDPSFLFNEIPLIFPGTINSVQGQTGMHKSRFLEIIAAVHLTKNKDKEICGFRKVTDDIYDVIFFDTERNHKNEFANGVNHILQLSEITDYENFYPIPLRQYSRGDRFAIINSYLESINTGRKKAVFIDIGTDLLYNFNDPREVAVVLDYLIALCDKHNATIFIAVHENPVLNHYLNSKMRGHFGSEVNHKDSIAFGLSRYKKGNIKLEIKKLRGQKDIEPKILKFNEEFKTLELVGDLEDVDSTEFTPLDGILEYLSTHFQSSSELKQSDAVEFITGTFSCSANTAKTRLIEIISGKMVIPNNNGEECRLVQISSKGKPTIYQLKLAS